MPGTVGTDGGESRPFAAKVGFAGDRLIRIQAKIGDVVLGPAVAPAGSSTCSYGTASTVLANTGVAAAGSIAACTATASIARASASTSAGGR